MQRAEDIEIDAYAGSPRGDLRKPCICMGTLGRFWLLEELGVWGTISV